MDEVQIEVGYNKKQDLTQLENKYQSVDFIMAVSPWVEDGRLGPFEVIQPQSHQVWAQQLFCRHRNCKEIYNFCILLYLPV